VTRSKRLGSRRAGALLAVVLAALSGGHLAPAPAVTPGPGPTPPPATTPPARLPPGAASDPVLVGAGDIADCRDRTGAQATAAILDRTAGTIFTLGDNAYVDGTPAEFQHCYAPDWGRHKHRTRFAVAGNHDYNTPGAAGHYGYFGAAAGDPARGYHDALIGDWHVIVLNSNCEAVGGCGLGSPQERWLRSVLAASRARCTLAMWHHPKFSSATIHRAFPTYQPFWEALYEHGADVVLAASDHVYERFGLQTPTGEADPDFGLRQFTVGTGGRSHQSFKAVLPNSEVRNGSTYGVISLTLHENSYSWRFIPEAGKTFTDEGTDRCHGAPPADPPEPGPITEIGSSSNASAAARALTLARPVGTATGDVMVASLVSGDGSGYTAPEGWAVVRDDAVPGRLRQTIFVKAAGPAEPDSYTWTVNGRGRIAGGLTAYAGVDPTDPVDAHAGAARTDMATWIAAPSITTTAPGSRLIQFSALNAEGTISPPLNLAQRWLAVSPGGDSRDALAGAFDTTIRRPGPTGRRASTVTEPGARIGVLVALRPRS
jgi:hypothetical protein